MKHVLAHKLAKQHGTPAGDAADQIDRTVSRLLRALRHGKPARLPGIGTIEPGEKWILRPDRNDR